MLKKLRELVLVGLVLISGIVMSVPARAANSKDSTVNNIGYSVSAKIPKNQIDKKNSFFDLKMDEGQKETIQATIYNSTNQDIQIETAIHTAYTNTNGTVEYVTPAKRYDPSLKYKISNITKLIGNKKVTVPANGSKVVSAKITMPSVPFNGVMLGGWYFKRVDQKVTGEVKGAMNIKSQYSYVIGLKYSSGKIPEPNMKLGSVDAGMINYHRSIIATLRNPTAVMIPNLKIQTTITNKNSNSIVKKDSKKNVQMAPNAEFNYPLMFNNTKLQAGKYHLHMVVKNDTNQWIFDRDFVINQKIAQKYNKSTVDNNGISIWWLIGLGALAMLVLVLLILFIVMWLRKRSKK